MPLVIEARVIRPASARRHNGRAEADDFAIGSNVDFRAARVAVANIAARGCAMIVVARLPGGRVGIESAFSRQVRHGRKWWGSAGAVHEVRSIRGARIAALLRRTVISAPWR